MRASLRFGGCFFLALTAALLAAAPKGNPKSSSRPSAVMPPKVAYVLASEQHSAVDRRAELAALANSTTTNSAPARWHSGYVLQGDEWQSFDAIRPSPERAALLAEYELRRLKLQPTGDSHLALANWCKSQGLRDREEAHLTQVLVLGSEKNGAEACQRLGYQRVFGTWVSPEELADFGRTQQQADQSLREWEPKLGKLLSAISGTGRKREKALADLEAIRDPGAVPAIEWLMCGQNESTAALAIHLLSKTDCYESTIALARQGVFNKWPAVRAAAGSALVSRQLEDFVPQLLGLLSTPIQGRVDIRSVVRNDQGFSPGILLYNYVLARETDDQFQLAALRTIDFRSEDGRDEFGPMLLRPSRRRPTTEPTWLTFGRHADARAANDTSRAIQDEEFRLEKATQAANERIGELNGRVTEILSKVSEEPRTDDVHKYWEWWRQRNKLEKKKKKEVVYVRERQLGNAEPPPHLVMPRSCFVGGTPVWTDAGLKPIETVLPGDSVLSQDLETGELGFQPVLQTTRRSEQPTLNLHIAKETLCVTGGHRFWVAGDGWRMASELQTGKLLHTATASVSITAIEAAEPAVTYNLVVPRTHNYFVGQIGLLTHDVALPRPTNRKVPGLVEKP